MKALIVFPLFLYLLGTLQHALAYDNGMAGTPPRGWTTWCTDDLCGLRDICTEREVEKRVEAMVNNGMLSAGYEWILLDDCWSDHERGADGNLQADKSQFPRGMGYLADFVHRHGMKLGIYTCIGTETCRRNRPGSYGYYEQDAIQMASWGIDMVKTDYCNKPSNETGQDLYTQFSHALNATGRPMLFYLCQWGEDEVWEWAGEISQMYRVQMDHLPFWNFPPTAAGQGYGQGVNNIIDWMADRHPSKFSGPYQWMDPDFLMTLFDPLIWPKYKHDIPYTMNYTNSRSEFTFWSLWSSPLLVSTDVYNMTEEKKSILLNKEVLAIHSDPFFKAGERLMKDEETGAQIWVRELSNGDTCVVLFNSGNFNSIDITLNLADLGHGTTAATIRDLWKGVTLGDFEDIYTAPDIPVHDLQMLRLQWVN